MRDDAVSQNDIQEKEQVMANESVEPEEIQINEWQNKYKRALADYQNLEKRVREERGDLIRSANRDILLRFLPILDTLLMAEAHTKDQTLSVCVQQFLDTLKSENVTRIKTVGEQFNPEIMEVITTGPGKEGVVMSEVRSGFLLHDKLLRPAQVIVGNGEKEIKEKN